MTDVEKALVDHRRGRWGRRYRLWKSTVGAVTLIGWAAACPVEFAAVEGLQAAGWEAPAGPAAAALAAALLVAPAPAVALGYAAACLSGLADRPAGVA